MAGEHTSENIQAVARPALAWMGDAEPSSSTDVMEPSSSTEVVEMAVTPIQRLVNIQDASLWDEQRGDPLPAELHRRLATAMFSYPPPPIPCSPFPRPYASLRQALRRPPWHTATMRARIKRVKRQGGLYLEFYLELPGYLLFLMAARKLSRSMTTYYALSLERDEVISRDSPHYIGKLRASDVGGVEWVLFDHGPSMREAAYARPPRRETPS